VKGTEKKKEGWGTRVSKTDGIETSREREQRARRVGRGRLRDDERFFF